MSRSPNLAPLAVPRGLSNWAEVTLPAADAAAVIERLVVLAAAAGFVLLAAWYAASLVTALVCLVGAAAGRRWRAGERSLRRWGAPVLRGAAVWALGLLAGTALGVASAAAQVPSLPDDLGWHASPADSPAEGPGTPEAAARTAAPSTAAPGTTAPGTAASARETPTPPSATAVLPPPADDAEPHSHVVRPGDSLWSIAAAHLAARGAPTTDAAVSAQWPRWYAANAAVVGPDPDLIHPGQTLLAPPTDGDPR